MDTYAIPEAAQEAVRELRGADIVVGIPSYNNARTIGHVVRAAEAGMSKYFPGATGIIVNSDGGSTDGTRDAVISSSQPDSRLLLLASPIKPAHRLSLPYHGIPGKGSAFRMIFQIAKDLDAKACVVVDSDLRSITPEWIDLLARPVLDNGYDFIAPYYRRHKYDGTITNSIVYPLTRALYGKNVRQPIGGDFGMSQAMVSRYLERNDWETDVARFGIDIWMTTIALAEGFRVGQSFLGAKLHDAKDPGADLSAMLLQVVGSVFSLMQEYEAVWPLKGPGERAEVFGFPYEVGLDPIDVRLDRMIRNFRQGEEALGDIWKMALRPDTLSAIHALARGQCADEEFHLDDEIWVRVIYEFAAAHRALPLERGHLIRSLTPLYMARVASFVNETRTLDGAAVEECIERLCVRFEERKPYLQSLWTGRVPAESEIVTS